MEAMQPFHHWCQSRQLPCRHSPPAFLNGHRGMIPLPKFPVQTPGGTPELPLYAPPESHLPHTGKFGRHTGSSHKNSHMPVVDKHSALPHGFEHILHYSPHVLEVTVVSGTRQGAESLVSLPMPADNTLTPLMYRNDSHQPKASPGLQSPPGRMDLLLGIPRPSLSPAPVTNLHRPQHAKPTLQHNHRSYQAPPALHGGKHQRCANCCPPPTS
mmetsp:Transcript_102079/g.233832  ORF Transcript_102079/g.233832 Transcript_102079/m.233832 type:complete len:213 (-) Transcript_102079:235-873(-)